MSRSRPNARISSLEAKRGWNLPTVEQLAQYATRFTDSRASRLLVVAECTPEWVQFGSA